MQTKDARHTSKDTKKIGTKKDQQDITQINYSGSFIFILCLFILTTGSAQDTTNIQTSTIENPETFVQSLFSIFEMFGVIISSPVKALILFILPLIIRYIERRNLIRTINFQKEQANELGIVFPEHRSIWQKIKDKIKLKR